MKDKTKKVLKITVAIVVLGGVAYIIADKNKVIKKLTDRVTILEEIVSEEVLEEAIATTTRKYNYRCDKVEIYKLREGEDAKAKLQEHLYFKDLFEKRLKDFNKLKAMRYIEQWYANYTTAIMRRGLKVIFTPVSIRYIWR